MSGQFQFLGDAYYTSSNKTFNLTTTSPTSYGYAYTDNNPALNCLKSAWYYTPANSNVNFNYTTVIGDTNSNVEVKYNNSNIQITLSGSYIYTSNVNNITRYNSSNNILINNINNKIYVKYNTSNLIALSNSNFIPQSYETSAYVSVYGGNSPQSSNFIHRIKNLYVKNHFAIENDCLMNSNVSILGDLIVGKDIVSTCNLSVGRILNTQSGNNRIAVSGYGDIISRSVNVWGAGDRYGLALDNYANLRVFGSGASPNSTINLSKATDDYLDGANAGFFDFIKVKCSTGFIDIQSNVGINTTSQSNYSLNVGGNANVTNKITCYETSSSVITTLNTTSRTLKLPKGGTIGFPGYPTIEFNYDDTGKQTDAGKITYGQFTSNTLEIVGGGSVAGSRAVKVFDNLTVDKTVNAQTVSTSNLTINTTLKMGGVGTDIKTIVATRFNLGTGGSQQKTFEVYLGFNCTDYLVFLTPEINYNGQHDFTVTVGAKLNDYFKIYVRRVDSTFWGADLYVNVMVVCLASPT